MTTDAWDFELIEEMSEAEIAFNLAGLPQEAHDLLAEGPWPEPMCGVCRALDTLGEIPAAQALLDYHDTPFRRQEGTKHYREGREVYARCLEIYRAAGWSE